MLQEIDVLTHLFLLLVCESRPSVSGSFLKKTPEELKKIVEASNRATAKMKTAESLAKGPHFRRIYKKKTVN